MGPHIVLDASDICVANSTGVKLETALEAALAKYDARLAERGDADSGR